MGTVLSVLLLSVLFCCASRKRKAIDSHDAVPAKKMRVGLAMELTAPDGDLTVEEFFTAESSSVAAIETDQDAPSVSRSVAVIQTDQDALCSVPNELVIAIAELLPDSDVVHMSILSRRLHYIAVPIYLRRHGLRISGENKAIVLLREDAVATLSFWRHTLLFQCPRTIRVTINSDNLSEYVQLGHFFSSLEPTSPLRTVKLVFNASPGGQLINLLETLRHSCVSDITLWHRSNKICRPALPSKPISCTQISSFPSLETFQPQAAMLFDSSLCQWTLTMINSSTIGELSLITPGLASPPWSHILERLVIPSLHILRIEGELTQIALDRFLRRHGGMRELHIGYHSDCGGAARRRSPPPELPHLRVLAAPLTYLPRLLGDERMRITTLERLTILPDFDCDNTAEFVCNFSKVLVLVSELQDLWWLNCTLPPLFAADVDETVSGGFGLQILDALFPQIKCIVLEQASRENRQDSFSMTLLNYLPRWLRQFPALSSLQLWEDAAVDRTEEMARLCAACATLSDFWMYSGGKDLSWKFTSAEASDGPQ
ncbi:uncharacterized protein LAESUDRAFT_764797 [Laetiporus sulphureus 93-53]|uniref:F-box domain-containing protein n=1 Tax=Laetiporus sulphureus 93-53 TaxID=1314785 RepID=A0A165B4D8_9APHY|nr:uncharacterized protein LAESUDRAFT_764797 [Laetiporus sulphureus 93-53]KZT00207.1 hypothetical protein LAESUDRAFT_764797 [Laetiporus sulphureus 93-53]